MLIICQFSRILINLTAVYLIRFTKYFAVCGTGIYNEKRELAQIKTPKSENISQFEFIKPFKRLFLRYGKEKYRQSCLSSNKSP